MGVVYEAEATRLGKRLCAVKVLLPEYTRNENAVARFAREAQVAGRVKHPNVVEIFDTGTTRDGLGYIAMELLRGESLDRTLAPRWPAAVAARPADHPADLPRARGRPRGGHRPPRHEAGELLSLQPRRRCRLHQGARLRHRQA
jgi:serine/threonine protein kinase